MKYTINLLFLASLLSLCGIQNLKASQGFKWNTNVTIDEAFLAANPGPFDSLVIYWSGSGAKPTLTIDLAGGLLPMVYKTGYIKAFNQAKLIIKNCKIEGAHARKLWQGIILWNASTSTQNTSLEMENCTLNYAWDGVYNGTILNPIGPIPSNGALLNIKSSVFYNCRTGVTFAPYNGLNASIIESTKFTWDKQFDTSYYIKSYENEFMYGSSPTFKDSQQFRTHILLVKGKGVKLLGNEYYNLRRWQEWSIDIVNGYKYQRVQSSRRKGTGVFALSSTIYVGAKGPCYETSTNEPDCYKCYGKKSLFEGLYIGVLALNSETIDPAQQSIEIMDSKFHNNTNSIVAGAHSIGINTNLGTSLDKPVRNVYVSNCEFNTDNGYYYHEAIMSKNSTDIFLEEVVNYHIIKNKFIKEYDDPDRYNPTDQVCFGAYGAAYLGNIYIKNCSIYVPHGVGGNWGTLIYKNYFQNRPWVRCTSNFGSITFDGENQFTNNSVTDVPVECNYFNNSHPTGHVFGSVNDITFRPDESSGNKCLFSGYSFGSVGNPSHNKFTHWDSCNGIYDRYGYNFFFMPQNVTVSGGKWTSNPSPIEYYFNTDASIFPQQHALQCVLDKGANYIRTGTTFSGNNGYQICYPQIYGKTCPKNLRPSEVLPASQNPNSESYSTFLVHPQSGNTGLQATTVFGVSVGPNPYSGGPLYVNYNFPSDVFYIVLYIYDAEGNLKTTLLLSKDNFDAEGKIRIDTLMNTLPPGTYYFTFKNSKGEWQTIIVQVQ